MHADVKNVKDTIRVFVILNVDVNQIMLHTCTQHFKILTPLFHCFCLFVSSFSSHSRIFHSYGDVTIAGELTNAWHSYSLSSDRGFLSMPHLL